MANLHVADVGTVLEATILDQAGTIVNLSTATVKQLWFGRPDNTVLQKPAAFSTDGTDGKIRYTLASGDFMSPGVWTMQGYVSLPAGSWHSDIVQFTVVGNLL